MALVMNCDPPTLIVVVNDCCLPWPRVQSQVAGGKGAWGGYEAHNDWNVI